MLNLSFLGGLQADLNGRPLTHFRSINTQALLVYLALQPGRAFPRETLAALLWPEESEAVARSNLRQSLHTLRTLLGDQERPDQPYLVATRETVAFNPPGAWTLDVADFLAAIEAQDLETAVSVYAGDLLAGFTNDSLPFEEWLRQEREGLHHLALEAMVEATADYLAAGQPEKARALAQRQINLEPWREAAHRQLMTAYALAGDRANALAQYERCRAALAEELDVEPEVETTALYQAIKAGRTGPRQSAERIQPPPSRRHNLPAATTPLIGRESDLLRLRQLFAVEGQRLVTIGGPGGMGKTRLAQEAGRNLLGEQFQEVYLVDLTPLEEVEALPATIAAALAYRAPDAARDLFPQLLEAIGKRRLLLILDNFEHLLAGAALVNDLLLACPNTAVLVTSRQWLNLVGESHYELGGLEVPDALHEQEAASYTAVQLFVESARRVQPDFVLNEENCGAIAQICRLVQGMPLGLLLAAAWLNLLTPQEVAGEIEDSLDFLAADLADLPPRQRSIGAVFERSWAMMNADEQAVLACLSIFRGGFTREAAGVVAGANLRHLLALVNKSLLQRDAAGGRFMMHELLRQFAAHKRRAQYEQIGLRHCRYFAAIAQKETRRALGFYPHHLPKEFQAERANFQRAWLFALDHGLAEEILALARGLSTFKFFVGNQEPLEEPSIEALRRHGVADNHPAVLYLRLMDINMLHGDAAIRRAYREVLAEVEALNDPELCFWAFEGLATYELALYGGSLPSEEAIVWIDRAVYSARKSGDALLIRQAEAEAVWVRAVLGQLEEVDPQALQDMLAFFETDFPKSFVVYQLLWALAAYYNGTAAYDEAVYYGNRCLNMAIDWHDLGWMSKAFQILFKTYKQLGQEDQVARLLLDDLGWHLGIGQDWQMLGFLSDLSADSRTILGSPTVAVSVMSMIYHHPQTFPSYNAPIDRARPQFEREMGAEAFTAAWEQGKHLDLRTVVSQVRAALEKTAA